MSDFREGFWEMLEPELGLKGRTRKKGEENVFFLGKIKVENKQNLDRNKPLEWFYQHYYFISQKIKTKQNKHKRSVWLS